jgi:hypothetical protein
LCFKITLKLKTDTLLSIFLFYEFYFFKYLLPNTKYKKKQKNTQL